MSIRVNSVVSSTVSSRYGVVKEIKKHDHRTLAVVHMIDPNTGDPMECPDKARCQHKDTCPIHGFNTDTHALTAWPAKDMAYYVNEGIVSKPVARLATCAHINIERRASTKYKITASKEGHVCNTVIITNHNDEWQAAVALCNVNENWTQACLTNPDAEDYKTFENLFIGTPLGPIN